MIVIKEVKDRKEGAWKGDRTLIDSLKGINKEIVPLIHGDKGERRMVIIRIPANEINREAAKGLGDIKHTSILTRRLNVPVLEFIAFKDNGLVVKKEETIRSFPSTDTAINGKVGGMTVKAYKIQGSHKIILLGRSLGGNGGITIVTKGRNIEAKDKTARFTRMFDIINLMGFAVKFTVILTAIVAIDCEIGTKEAFA